MTPAAQPMLPAIPVSPQIQVQQPAPYPIVQAGAPAPLPLSDSSLSMILMQFFFILVKYIKEQYEKKYLTRPEVHSWNSIHCTYTYISVP